MAALAGSHDEQNTADLAETLSLLSKLTELTKQLDANNTDEYAPYDRSGMAMLNSTYDDEFGGYDSMNGSYYNGTQYAEFNATAFMDGFLALLNSTSMGNGTRHENHFEMPAGKQHNGMMVTLADLSMICFIYYVPRMLYYRATRFGEDRNQSGFGVILSLSVVALAGAAIHTLSFHHSITSSMAVQLFTGSLDLDTKEDYFIPFLYSALKASINRAITPCILVLCLQQLVAFDHFGFPGIQNNIVQIVLCGALVAASFVYSFFFEYQNFQLHPSPKSWMDSYPDAFSVDVLDLLPVLTAALFFFTKHKITRKAMYSIEKSGPECPSVLDRVSKVVVFQAIMAIAAIGALFLREPNDTIDSVMTFLIAAQTPAVQWVLFRSLLRSRRPTRICFLMCCTSEEKVDAAEKGLEMNNNNNNNNNNNKHQPRKNDPSERNGDEDDEEDEPTKETLDHNKINLEKV